MSHTALHAYRWTGASLRNISYDLNNRTLVIEVLPSDAETLASQLDIAPSLCRRVVVTNCDCTFAGQLLATDTGKRQLVDEPLVLSELGDADVDQDRSNDSVVFATATGSVVATGGIASIDEFVLNAEDLPLDDTESLDLLDDWLQKAA